ncbi:STAS domain-containing protein [Streptomyces sp. NPDC054787]
MTTPLIALRTTVRDDHDQGPHHRPGHASHVRVALVGELDIHTAIRVEPRLTELARSGSGELVLDLSGLAFCDSSGIDLFLRLHRRCAAGRTGLRLTGVPPLLAKSLRVLGADRVLTC